MPPTKEPTWREIGEGIVPSLIPYQITLIVVTIMLALWLLKRYKEQQALTIVKLGDDAVRELTSHPFSNFSALKATLT